MHEDEILAEAMRLASDYSNATYHRASYEMAKARGALRNHLAAHLRAAPGFSPMHLAPIDGTAVLLYMPTCGDRFAIGVFHSNGPDSISGHWGDDEGGFYTHTPVAFMALDNLARLLGPGAQAAAAASLGSGGDAAKGGV